ncbi:Aldose 1-epimerase [Lactobacillus bombicola]|uniref:Aldose 1-epimerase n=1 Tax=Lactobacillus bombicola TaxID=1505723 RepID=A0A1I1RQY7_9LACO|nr:hypothetical protein [Lactobacillus bombicola]MCO6527364.1 aldose epimerase [Lactobacillus sp.]SFD36552.1 Aldose 1-epimerase [Lactobacillus bombicola]
MQIIESSILRIAIDEKRARLVNLISQNNQIDYFKDGDLQRNLIVNFTGENQNENLAKILPWTIVDKGDSRISLALIDDNSSYKKFPYHFEVILTYAVEGNRVDIKYYLKNNSYKTMPFSLSLAVDIPDGWAKEEKVNEVILSKNAVKLQCISSSLALAVKNNQIVAAMKQAELEKDHGEEFGLSLLLT